MKNSVKLSAHPPSRSPLSPNNSTQYSNLNDLYSKRLLNNSKRGITPAPSIPLKLMNPKKLHQTQYNIITNRDAKNENSVPALENKLMTQQNRDYQDYTKSEYSFDYKRTNNNGKKFSYNRIARKYMSFYDGKMEREIPNFVRELINNEDKLTKTIEDVYSIKNSLFVKDL